MTLKGNWLDTPDKAGYYWLVYDGTPTNAEILVYVNLKLDTFHKLRMNPQFEFGHDLVDKLVKDISGKWQYITPVDRDDVEEIQTEIRKQEKVKKLQQLEDAAKQLREELGV